jgi:AhpD family alkylhydroperoxidase
MSEDPSNPYDHTRKVSRLPPLPKELDPVLKQRFDATVSRGGQILNLHRTGGHAPQLAKARSEFTWALRSKCVSSRFAREMAILRTAFIVDCAYEVNHHYDMALKAGLTKEQVEALKGDWRKQENLFDDKGRALLTYLDGLVGAKGQVSDAAFNDMLKHFTPREVVELTYCATHYYANGLFVKALGIEIDPPHVKTAAGTF